RHTSFSRDWSSDVCSSDLHRFLAGPSAASLLDVKVELERALGQGGERAALHAAYSCVLSLAQFEASAGQGATGGNPHLAAEAHEIGRASCRERGEGAAGAV